MMDAAFCQQQTDKVQSTIPWLRSLQQQGMAALQRLGFPKRQDEDWRYTAVDGLLQHAFQLQQPQAATDDSMKNVLHSVPWGQPVTVINGVIEGLEALQALLPAGVIVETLQNACQCYPEKVQTYLDQALNIRHGFHAQNTAMLGLGLFIYIPEDIKLAEPIVCIHRQTQPGEASYVRHVIVAEVGAQLTFIEDYQGDAETSYFTNTISEVFAHDKAAITHYKIQRESRLAYHVGHVAIEQAAESHVRSHVLNLGGRLSRSDICCYLRAPHAYCQLNGLYAPCDQQHMDHHIWIYHQAEACESAQDYKGILNGKSRAVFNGQIHVGRLGQKTIAKQQNKNLLLSKQAEIDTKPQLDIAADDVICTHGATVGQLDADALFYFATRGIDEQQATQYLIQAFAADNLRAVSHDGLATWMRELLTQQLRAHYE
jgi:Fe-S cluster assembly protein SufD